MSMPVDKTRMDTKNQNGFTLIELMVAMAVAAILLGIGIPSFSSAVQNSKIGDDYQKITQALYMARSEAVKSNSPVTVCPKTSPDAEQCGSSAEDWKHGWIVFIDNVIPPGEQTTATVDAQDEIISLLSEPRSKNTITAVGSSDKTASSATARSFITYRREGKANWASGSFLLCNDEDPDLSRVLNVAPTGDVRKGRRSGTEYPRDVFNREACK